MAPGGRRDGEQTRRDGGGAGIEGTLLRGRGRQSDCHPEPYPAKDLVRAKRAVLPPEILREYAQDDEDSVGGFEDPSHVSERTMTLSASISHITTSPRCTPDAVA